MIELADLVKQRAEKRGLSVSLEKMEYATQAFFAPLPEGRFENALFVGVGHGHDALVALAGKKIIRVVGVDPYIESDGNGEEDYQSLLETIRSLGLTDHFVVHKATIQEFLIDNHETFDLIVIADVLHHIFVSLEPLSKSVLFDDAKSLFSTLKDVAPNGYLAISDVQRHGLRPWLHRVGLLPGSVDYRTKQSHRQWDYVVTQAGWSGIGFKNYLPYRLRKITFLLDGLWGRWSLCDKYFLYYKNELHFS